MMVLMSKHIKNIAEYVRAFRLNKYRNRAKYASQHLYKIVKLTSEF